MSQWHEIQNLTVEPGLSRAAVVRNAHPDGEKVCEVLDSDVNKWGHLLKRLRQTLAGAAFEFIDDLG